MPGRQWYNVSNTATTNKIDNGCVRFIVCEQSSIDNSQ